MHIVKKTATAKNNQVDSIEDTDEDEIISKVLHDSDDLNVYVDPDDDEDILAVPPYATSDDDEDYY